MFIEEITSVESLADLAPEWSGLHQRCPDVTPFQTPEWLLPFWQCFGRGELRLLTAYSNNVLAAVIPFVREHGMLSFIGTGLTDYQDAVIAPQSVPEIREFLQRYLPEHGCELDCIRWNSPLRSLEGSWVQCNTSPILSLPSTFAEYEQSLSPHFRKSLDYAWNKLNTFNEVRVVSAHAETAQPFLDRLVRLHCERWSLKQMPGVLSTPEVLDFHRKAITGLVEAGRLLLLELRLGDDAIASLYILRDRCAAYYYIGGFSPELDRFSPGSLLILHAIRECIESNIREFHFLRGSEAYKYRWKAEDRPLYRLTIESSM